MVKGTSGGSKVQGREMAGQTLCSAPLSLTSRHSDSQVNSYTYGVRMAVGTALAIRERRTGRQHSEAHGDRMAISTATARRFPYRCSLDPASSAGLCSPRRRPRRIER
jgi:hypothetical protein